MRELWRIITGILQEISGQSAYQRHLKWHGLEHSPAEWRRFCDQQWAKEARRGRCC